LASLTEVLKAWLDELDWRRLPLRAGLVCILLGFLAACRSGQIAVSTSGATTAVPAVGSPTLSLTATLQPTLQPATPLPTATPTLIPTPATAITAAIPLRAGPHLFLDDYWIAGQDHLQRVVNAPQRVLNQPVVTGFSPSSPFDNFNYSAAVLYDAATNRFRMWYVAFDQPANVRYTAYTESADGIHWQTPPRRLDSLKDFEFTNILDLGAQYPDPARRYMTIVPAKTPYSARAGNALFSPDGIIWTPYAHNPVTTGAYGEVWSPYYDPLLKIFGLLHRWNKSFQWTDAQGQFHDNSLHDPGITRLIAFTSSISPTTFAPSTVTFAPDSQDSGETQFYGTSNVIRRGDYLIASLSVLRDDLKAPATPDTVPFPGGNPQPVFGSGYSVLAWSRDGQIWHRDRAPDTFLAPSADANNWDHAVTWINSIVPIGDRVLLYYGAYQYGHKVYSDRQVGLVSILQDRYVARVAGNEPGSLHTPLIKFSEASVSLNVDASRGELKLQFLDFLGQPIPGFTYQDCQPITVNALQAPVVCGRPLSQLVGQPVRLVFELQNASLYAFNIGDPNAQAQ
jgi:hypothetical protein